MAELLDFNFDINDDTGDLDIITKPVVKAETQITVDENTNIIPDANEARFAFLESQLSKSNNMLFAIGQYITGKDVQQQQIDIDNVEDQELEGVFVDVEKGKKFINSLVSKVTQRVEDKLKVLDPVIANSTIQNEFVQFAQQHSDIQEYLAGMKMLHSTNNNLPLDQLYTMAKGLGLKQVKQDIKPSNVINIDRNLPDKTNSENANLQQKREAKTPKEALDLAMEELGYAV